MADLVLEVLNNSTLDIVRSRGQSYNGMQVEIKKAQCKHADYSLCAAYSLYLVSCLLVY